MDDIFSQNRKEAGDNTERAQAEAVCPELKEDSLTSIAGGIPTPGAVYKLVTNCPVCGKTYYTYSTMPNAAVIECV